MSAQNSQHDALVESGLPLFFRFQNQSRYGFNTPENRNGQTIRSWVRSLSVMQKEAVVLSPGSEDLWRLSSDEGPYLKGFDSAPCPLAFFTTGLAASWMSETMSLARMRGIPVDDIVLVVDSFYSMKGSALQGTMQGGALTPRLEAFVDSSASDQLLAELFHDAVRASPVCALIREPLQSLFTLTVNGASVATARVPALRESGDLDSDVSFGQLGPATAEDMGSRPVRKLTSVESRRNVAGGYATSLAPSQDRGLHIRGTCRLRPDGTKEIRQELFSPLGSSFLFLSDEARASGGAGKAPDAASYAAAGIAFCFMTQLGRYASIVKQELPDYRVIQDVHFSQGSAGDGVSGAGGVEGRCDAVETHLHLHGPVETEFARTLLDMGEQTCFLHALCRTALDIDVEWHRGVRAGKDESFG